MNQSEADDASKAALFAFYGGLTGLVTCNLLLNFPANVYVLWLIVNGVRGAVASEFFSLNLAVLEIIFCVSSLFIMLNFLLRLEVEAILSLLQCFVQLVFIFRPLFQSCICMERYLAVVHPTTFLRFKPLRYKSAFCLLNWLLVSLYCIILSVTLSGIQVAYHLIGNSTFFLLVMSYCGLHILCVLKQPEPGNKDQVRKSRSVVKRKAFKVIMITLVFTSSLQLLQILILWVSLLFTKEQAILNISLVSLAISMVSGLMTPLLHLYRQRKLPCVSEQAFAVPQTF
ncbi:proteinase-activated receptor 3-like [Echeneis naucrates]|uniref:proteinase-activated receptor 3-like n=1 Tax=Echeneis naucrates TaxID=173247 RepID=UPI0011134DDE|nr:proteinase-activated receptor 3-like [Echeneis naucrates]